ncbi:MAG: agmatine deiminase family protein [Cetobacterium sp.]|uniref:agmatine deiminase family protein n=1 Tax=Cetobacterium sp. TaxID=2071632 RepID=UPI002FC605E0
MNCSDKLTPRELGFRQPGEWEARKRTFMQWPVRDGSNSTTPLWPDGMESARRGYAAVAKAIAEFDELVMIAPEHLVGQVKEYCGDKVKVLSLAIDDSWIRDNGPTFLINDNEEIGLVKWRFTSYGEKYQTHYNDGRIPDHLSIIYDVPMFKSPLALEGGGIHSDGQGTIMTTEPVALSCMRNSRFTKEEVEELLKNYLGGEQVIMFKSGLYGDLTDGHVDNVACFVRPGVIAIQACYDINDPDYEIYQANLKTISNYVDRASGLPFEIIEIEKPPRRFYKGQLLTMSYINYLPVEGAVVVPTFGGDAAETDRKALETLQKAYPDRKIVPIDGMPIIIGGGCVHCITQQMPAGKSL